MKIGTDDAFQNYFRLYFKKYAAYDWKDLSESCLVDFVNDREGFVNTIAISILFSTISKRYAFENMSLFQKC